METWQRQVWQDPLPLRRQLAAEAGIVPVDPGAADPAMVHRDLAGGRLPEIVIEATGAPAVIDDDTWLDCFWMALTQVPAAVHTLAA